MGDNVHHRHCTLSQLEMDAVGVLLEFSPSNQSQEHAVLQWSGKRKRSQRLVQSNYEGEEFCSVKNSSFDEGELSVPRKRKLSNTDGRKLSKDLINTRVTSPNSPLPSSQMQSRTIRFGASSAPHKVYRVAVEETSLMSKPWSVPKVEENKMHTKDLDTARCKDVVVESNASKTPTSDAKMQPGAQVPSKSANAFFLKILCKQLLRLAVRLGWEVEGMRHTKKLLIEELQSMKNQNFHHKQQHSSIKTIQTTDPSKSQAPSSPSLAQARHTVPQNRKTIGKADDDRAGGTTDSPSESIEQNLNYEGVSTTPSTNDLKGLNSKECIFKAPDCISWTSPPKDMYVQEAQAEAIVEQAPSSAREHAQNGAHAELSFSNENGFIDANETWVIVPESAKTYSGGVHARLTCNACEDSKHQADEPAHAQIQEDLSVKITNFTNGTCKQKVTPTTVQTTSYCVEDIPARLAASHHHMNQCADNIPARWTTCSNHGAADGASSTSKIPSQGLGCPIDGVPVRRHTYYLQSLNPRVDNASVQLFPCLPLQMSSNAAVAQLASSIHDGLPQAIVLLCDRKFACAEARKRRKAITRIKRHQSRASKLSVNELRSS